MSKQKIQSLLINHLIRYGHIDLNLPDGMLLEIGIDQEGNNGSLIKKENYCWVIASQGNRATSIDSYNLGIRFQDEKDKFIMEDSFVDNQGEKIKRLDVV